MIEVISQNDLNIAAEANAKFVFAYLIANTENGTEAIVTLVAVVDMLCTTLRWDSGDVLDRMQMACKTISDSRKEETGK